MKKGNWRRLAVWMILLAMVMAGTGMTATAEDEYEQTEGLVVEEPLQAVEEVPEEEKPLPTEEGKEPLSTVDTESTADTLDEPGIQEETPVAYTLKYAYATETGEQSFSVRVLSNQPIQKPEFIPTLAGYTFAFWYDAEGDVTAFAFGSVPTKDMTLRAHFVENPTTEEEEDRTEETPTAEVPADGEQDDTEEKEEIFVMLEDLGIVIIANPEEEESGAGEEDGEIIIIEDEEVPLAGPGYAVTITSNAGEVVCSGDVITLTGETTGLDADAEYRAIWRYFDGSSWHEAANGTELSYTYVLSQDNFGWMWELEITILHNGETVQQTDKTAVL